MTNDEIDQLLARLTRRITWCQVTVQVAIQGLAYGSTLFLLWQINRSIQQALEALRSLPGEALQRLQF